MEQLLQELKDLVAKFEAQLATSANTTDTVDENTEETQTTGGETGEAVETSSENETVTASEGETTVA